MPSLARRVRNQGVCPQSIRRRSTSRPKEAYPNKYTQNCPLTIVTILGLLNSVKLDLFWEQMQIIRQFYKIKATAS